jgi:hypothetical protein
VSVKGIVWMFRVTVRGRLDSTRFDLAKVRVGRISQSIYIVYYEKVIPLPSLTT